MAVLAPADQNGWRGIVHNGKIFVITAFASLGGVLYGYNQGLFFSQVQVMAEFDYRSNGCGESGRLPMISSSS